MAEVVDGPATGSSVAPAGSTGGGRGSNHLFFMKCLPPLRLVWFVVFRESSIMASPAWLSAIAQAKPRVIEKTQNRSHSTKATTG